MKGGEKVRVRGLREEDGNTDICDAASIIIEPVVEKVKLFVILF